MTTTPTSGAAIQRYKIGYHSDEWGHRSSTPSGIPDASGSWVRYADHVTALAAGQAPKAAPEAKKSALRTYPNPIVPLIKPVSEQEKMRALYLASSNLMAYLGRNGAIHSDGHAADVLMNCLNDLDGGEFDETLFAASPTPPAEQQAAPKAAPGVGNSGFDHQTAADFLSGKTVSDEAVRKFVAASRWAHDERAALSATLLAMHGVLTSREAEIALLKKALLEAEAAPQPAPAPLSDAIEHYLESQDALDNWEYAGINAESYETLIRRRNASRNDLDAALAAQGGK